MLDSVGLTEAGVTAVNSGFSTSGTGSLAGSAGSPDLGSLNAGAADGGSPLVSGARTTNVSLLNEIFDAQHLGLRRP